MYSCVSHSTTKDNVSGSSSSAPSEYSTLVTQISTRDRGDQLSCGCGGSSCSGRGGGPRGGRRGRGSHHHCSFCGKENHTKETCWDLVGCPPNHMSGPISSVRRYSFRDIKSATDGFRRIIDNYCNAAAYKAKFQNGHVALVKEIRGFHDNDDVFYREVQLLGSLHHRHVVALSGFSAGQKRFLVFENIENGSLKEHLNDPLRTPLTWTTRLQIAVGVAAALEYLHFFCDPPIYHVSISSSTIMLDENFNAKLSDIGLLGTGENNVREPHSSCFEERRKQISRGMMFQLGVLILELITGQSSEDGGVELIKWVNFPGSIHNMLDPDLGDNYDSTELKSLLAVARLCIKSADKPAIFIQHILWYLQKKIGITRNMYR